MWFSLVEIEIKDQTNKKFHLPFGDIYPLDSESTHQGLLNFKELR